MHFYIVGEEVGEEKENFIRREIAPHPLISKTVEEAVAAELSEEDVWIFYVDSLMEFLKLSLKKTGWNIREFINTCVSKHWETSVKEPLFNLRNVVILRIIENDQLTLEALEELSVEYPTGDYHFAEEYTTELPGIHCFNFDQLARVLKQAIRCPCLIRMVSMVESQHERDMENGQEGAKQLLLKDPHLPKCSVCFRVCAGIIAQHLPEIRETVCGHAWGLSRADRFEVLVHIERTDPCKSAHLLVCERCQELLGKAYQVILEDFTIMKDSEEGGVEKENSFEGLIEKLKQNFKLLKLH